MATRDELELARRSLNRLTGKAKVDLSALLGELDLATPTASRQAAVAFTAVVQEYGTAAAALGADMAEGWASTLNLRTQLAIASPLAAADAAALTGWALAQPAALGSLAALTDQFVKQPYRETIQDTAHRSRAAWARVPMGAKTCVFCLMAASRGAVYRTDKTAGSDRKFHGDCDCQVVLVRGPEDYPEDYAPEAYLDIYSRGVGAAMDKGAKAPTTKQILAGMREVSSLS